MPSFLDLVHEYKENGEHLAEARLLNNALMISLYMMIKKMIKTQIEGQQKLNRAFCWGFVVADEEDKVDNH
jgi:hypothetical protein